MCYPSPFFQYEEKLHNALKDSACVTKHTKDTSSLAQTCSMYPIKTPFPTFPVLSSGSVDSPVSKGAGWSDLAVGWCSRHSKRSVESEMDGSERRPERVRKCRTKRTCLCHPLPSHLELCYGVSCRPDASLSHQELSSLTVHLFPLSPLTPSFPSPSPAQPVSRGPAGGTSCTRVRTPSGHTGVCVCITPRPGDPAPPPFSLHDHCV